MKRTALAVILISAFMMSVVVGALPVNLVSANPVWYLYFPVYPDTSSPLITVDSPTQQQTCSSTDVWLNFTVTKPESWFMNYDYMDQPSDEYFVVGKITAAYYMLDGAERQSIPVTDFSFFQMGVVTNPSRTLQVSTNLSLPEGTHSLTVSLEAESYYAEGASHHTVAVQGNSEVTSFTVVNVPEPKQEPEPQQEPAQEPKPEPTQEPLQQETLPEAWIIAAVATGIAACAGILVYFTKVRKPKNNKAP